MQTLKNSGSTSKMMPSCKWPMINKWNTLSTLALAVLWSYRGCISVCVNVWMCNSWPVTTVLLMMENLSAVTEARIFWDRKDLPQECNPTNYTWLRPIRECRCVQIIHLITCVACANFTKCKLSVKAFYGLSGSSCKWFLARVKPIEWSDQKFCDMPGWVGWHESSSPMVI